MATSHVEGMSIGPALSVREAATAPARGRPINQWWVGSGLVETAKTGNSAKSRAPLGAYEMLRFDQRLIARRSAERAANPSAWGSTAGGAQANPKAPPEISETPENVSPLSLASDVCVRPRVRHRGSAETAGTAGTRKSQQKRAWEAAAIRPAQNARIAQSRSQRSVLRMLMEVG